MRRVFRTFAVLMLILTICMPQNVHASSRVKVTYKGVTATYSKKKTYIYVNGQKLSLGSSPVFLKSGAYVGPLSRIFFKSALHVGHKASGNQITLTYKSHSLTLKDGSIAVVLDGKKEKDALGAIPMKAAVYKGTTSQKWIVPLKSVCKRLGLDYDMQDGVISITEPEADSADDIADNLSSEGADSVSVPANPSSKKVVLVMDAGHGGVDSGANGKLYREKNMTLAIVLQAKKYFDRDSRFKVLYTRTADTYPSLDDRCKLANKNNADLFICVHINSAGKTSTGTETLYSRSRVNATRKNGITSLQLATAMQKAVVRTTGFTNRGLVDRPNLRVLKKTNMPACLIEYGFISNPTEEKIMHAALSRYGRELYEGIETYLEKRGTIAAN